MEEEIDSNPLLDEETTYDQTIITRDLQNIDLLYVEQKALFDAVVDRVENPQESNAFFVDATWWFWEFFLLQFNIGLRSRNKICYRSLQVESPHAYYTRVKRRIQHLEFH